MVIRKRRFKHDSIKKSRTSGGRLRAQNSKLTCRKESDDDSLDEKIELDDGTQDDDIQ